MTLNILHVEAGTHLYGGALQVLYLLRGLQAAGLRNVLVCPRGSAIAAAARDCVDALYAPPIGGDLDLAFIARLWRIIRKEHPDIVHLHSRRGADVLGGIAARLAGARIVLTRRVDNPEPMTARWKYRLYDRVVTISQGIRAVLLRQGVPQDKVTCVPSAVDSAVYAGPCERQWFEREFALPPEARAIGTVAQLIERKGHRHLLRAIPAVVDAHPDAYFLLFGQGALADELRRQAGALGVAGHVRWCGFRSDLARILPCLYALAHPAEMEGLGVSLLQAAAAGVPLVGSAVGGIPEIVRDGVTGHLVAPRDPAALAAALCRLLAEPPAARALGEQGRAVVAREFSIAAMVQGNIDVYLTLAPGDRGVSPRRP